jgi:hypothetical protein
VKYVKGIPTMSRFLLAAVAVGVVAGLGQGADLKSGLEPGKSLPPFNVLNINGKSAGEKACPI